MLTGIASGDKMAFTIFFRAYYAKLIEFALLFVRGHANAEDIVSDVLVKLIRNRKKLPEIERFEGYLFLAVKNQCLNFIRKHRSDARIEPLEDTNDYFFREPETPEQKVLDGELSRLIQTTVDGFPPRRRMIYRLIKEEGLRYKEVATLLDISPKTVENHLDLAVKSMRAVVQNYLEESDTLATVRHIRDSTEK